MAEDFGDKTEAPTPRRRQEAREEGQVARSQDLTASVLMVGAMFMLKWFGPGLIESLRKIVHHFLAAETMANLDLGATAVAARSAVAAVAMALLPMLGGIMLLAVAANLAQVGFFFSSQRLRPDLSALNPLKGASRIFQGPALVQFGMNMLKLLLVGTVAYWAIRNRIDAIVSVTRLDFMQVVGLSSTIVYDVGLRLAVLLLVLAIIDYAWHRFHFERGLRMTKQEVKEDMKRMEGDPQIKRRRRQIAMQLAQQRLKKDVPTADVVVTNPTHIAVALKYEADTMHAPRVVAKGQGPMAQRIREIAEAAGIPIIERKPLARALYKMVEVGQEIPEEFYSVVAEILAYVYELSGKARRARGQPQPVRAA